MVVALVSLLRGARGDPVRTAIAAAFLALVFHTMLYAELLEDPVTWALLGAGMALAQGPRRNPGSPLDGAPVPGRRRLRRRNALGNKRGGSDLTRGAPRLYVSLLREMPSAVYGRSLPRLAGLAALVIAGIALLIVILTPGGSAYTGQRPSSPTPGRSSPATSLRSAGLGSGACRRSS